MCTIWGASARGEPKFLGVNFFYSYYFLGNTSTNGGFGAGFESTGIVVQNGI